MIWAWKIVSNSAFPHNFSLFVIFNFHSNLFTCNFIRNAKFTFLLGLKIVFIVWHLTWHTFWRVDGLGMFINFNYSFNLVHYLFNQLLQIWIFFLNRIHAEYFKITKLMTNWHFLKLFIFFLSSHWKKYVIVPIS